MPIALYRIDDRLIHGQVVVGWGKPLGLGFIVLADDNVAAAEWEQELYRLGVPPGVDVYFVSINAASLAHCQYTADPRAGILLTGDIASMLHLVQLVPEIAAVNVGGIHHRTERRQKLRYVFLTAGEEETLRQIALHGVDVTAQDVPSAHPVPLDDIIRGER